MPNEFTIPQGSPGSPDNPVVVSQEDELLFDEGIPNLFSELDRSQMLTSNRAANGAQAEVMILDDPASYEDRKAKKLNGDVEDASITRLRQVSKEQDLIESGVLDPGFLTGLSPEERFKAVSSEIRRVDLRDRSINPVDVALWETFLAGGGRMQLPEFEKRFRSVDVGDIALRRQQRVQQGRGEMRRVIDDIVASKDYDNYGQMVKDVAIQDFIPIYTLLSRLGLDREILERVQGKPVKGWSGFFLGELRQRVRDTLVAQSPDEYANSMRAMQQLGQWLERDEGLAKLVTNYNLLESMEAIFTEDVYNGLSSKNTFDRAFGNLETVLEGLFSVMTIAKVSGTVVRATYRATNANRARQVAAATDNADVASKIDEVLQADGLALEFDLLADEAAPTMLPRPAVFADDIDELPDSTKEVLIRSERIRNVALDQSDIATGASLTPADRTNVVNRVITDLDMNDGMHVQGRMNTLQMFDNDTGFRMRVVVGETAEGGWKKIEDVMDEALAIDPQLEAASIMRVNADGKLENVFDDGEAFARAVTTGEIDTGTAARILGVDTADETFYLAYDRDRFWHTADKEVLSPEAFQNSGVFPRAILAPNAKFGNEIYGTFLRAYMGEQALVKNLEFMFEPFYRLGITDKKFVASSYEWMEDFGKNFGRAPTIHEVIAKYDGITEAQLNGLTASFNCVLCHN